MEIKVAKFGGTSLACAETFRKVKAIIEKDPSRCFVVVSAPGKRSAADHKITDLLYACHSRVCQGGGYDDLFALIGDRYRSIAAALGLNLDLDGLLDEIHQRLPYEQHPDYAASRGEFLNAILLAAFLGYEFVDAAGLIRFNEQGFLDLAATEELIEAKLKPGMCAVVPGFYGTLPDGSIKTFPRGGSDITGALVARGVKASVYENWTDVSGFFMVDPRLVDDPKLISLITYKELRELAYNGANVLHEAAIYPVSEIGIPINIRNTDCPDHPGTMIVKTIADLESREVTGIAGQKGFVVIQVEKALMHSEMGFVRRLLSILEELRISFSHMPSGIDMVSLVIHKAELNGKLDQVLHLIRERLNPDKVEVIDEIALIATVGLGIANRYGIAARLFTALAQEKINVRMIDQGASGINLIVGVESGDFEQAVKAIYQAFVS
ncbi:MAG: aspartate kinase [Firmicutes bacterium]|nr:aspartate kinase [Bacillota bacterium]